MATTAASDVAELDQLIVRSLVTLRLARAACRSSATPKNLALRDSAEEDLNALLDRRADVRQRPPAERQPA